MHNRRKGIAAIVGSSAAIFWSGAFIFGLPGVMGPYWKETFRMGQGDIGNILFFVLAAVGIVMLFVGRWQERIGVRAMISIAAVMGGLDMVLLGFASHPFMLYLWAFIMGAASCFVYIPALTTVQKWYPTRRGLVTGIVNFMFAISAAIMGPVFRILHEAFGYFAMTVVLGFVSGVVGIAAAQFTGAPSDKDSPGSSQRPAPQGLQPDLDNSLTVAESIRTRSLRFLWLTWALQGAAGIAMVMLSIAYALSRGYTMESAVVVLTGFNSTSGLSRLISGYISDKAGRTFIMSLTFFLAGLAYFVLPHVAELWQLVSLAAVIGFAFGTLFAVSAPLAVDCFGIRHFGAIFGLVFTAYGFLAAPLGPSMSGYLLDHSNGNFTLVFGYLGVFCLISSVLIRFVRPPRT